MNEMKEEVKIEQEETAAAAATVTYNRYSKIKVYKQITNTSCAATCAGMCVKKSPADLQDDGFNIEWADWNGIATEYGYSTNGYYDINSLTEVVDVLAEGYPVIAKVNSSNPHWVVIYKFVGNPAAPVASNFTCADPWTGTSVTLTNATRYSSVGRVVVFR